MYRFGIPFSSRRAEGHPVGQLQSPAVPSPRLAARASRRSMPDCPAVQAEHPGRSPYRRPRCPHPRPGWSVVPAMLTAAVLLNSAALSSTLLFGHGFTHPGSSRRVPLSCAAVWAGFGKWLMWMGDRGSVKPFLLIVFPVPGARAPVAPRRVGRPCVGGELRGWRGRFRPGRACRSGSRRRGGQSVAVALPQRILPGIRGAGDVESGPVRSSPRRERPRASWRRSGWRTSATPTRRGRC